MGEFFLKSYSHGLRLAGRGVIVALLLTAALAGRAQAPLPAADALAAIRVQSFDGSNLALDEVLPDDHLLLSITSAAHNWFSGTLVDLPVGRPLTLGLSMEGRNAGVNRADVTKWRGLAPLFTYADPLSYESYEWFQRDAQGRWRSGDPLKRGAQDDAGDGPLPVQHVIPPALAAQFLTDGGQCWSPWREVESTAALTGVNIFRMRQAFEAPTATIALRIPFTYTYLQQCLERLTAAHLPGVSVDTLGQTREGRALQIIRLEDPAPPADAPPPRTILITAREHATEMASTWTLWGVLSALLQTETPAGAALRRETTWLLIPIQDPDSSVRATFEGLTEPLRLSTALEEGAPDGLAYAGYMADYVAAGRAIHFAVALHNVEANEGEHILCPFANARHPELAISFNRALFEALANRGYRTGDPEQPWSRGMAPLRLPGWCAERFGACDLTFEVNDRYPDDRLSPPRLHALGATLAEILIHWADTADGRRSIARSEQWAKLHRLERAAYDAARDEARTPREISADLLLRAF